MRILILGGTRFLGRRIAEILVENKHDLTLLSRRVSGAPRGARQICAERSAGLEALKGSSFDLVLDFICYNGAGPGEVAAYVTARCYVLISSTWVPRLWNGLRADELAPDSLPTPPNLSAVTLNYLSGKVCAEKAVSRQRKIGNKAVSLRLPIVLGEGDHTGRLDFYRHRLVDGGPLIAVEGGHNRAQIADMEDLAEVLVRWSTEVDIGQLQLWEALPGEGRSVRSVLEQIATSVGSAITMEDVSQEDLLMALPSYLDEEPLWRESSLPITPANVYVSVGMAPAVFGRRTMSRPTVNAQVDGLRAEELRFLASRNAH